MMAGHTPSVTGYVQQLTVGEHSMYAKISLLGTSLTSILQGRHGSWSQVHANQRRYLASGNDLLRREASQLQFLSALGLPTVDAGYDTGVLFTQPARGRSLAEIALTEPAKLAEPLIRLWRSLTRLHTSPHRCAQISERDITQTFARKFGNPRGSAERLGLTDHTAAAVLALLRTAALLRRAPTPTPGTGLVYGDLKPEHILLAPDGTITLIDPGITSGPVVADAAKLISRLLLALFCTEPDHTRDIALIESVQEFTRLLTTTVPPRERDTWWRDLVGLWLKDTTNILSTYLAAPPTLPLPAHATAVQQRAEHLCDLAERTATILIRHNDPQEAWRHGLARVIAR